MAQGLRQNPVHGQDRRLPGDRLELAKSLLAAADKAAAPTKAKLAGNAMAILTEMTRTPSGYQQEAIRLRRDRLGGSGEPGTFDEAIVEGDANAAEKKWDDAVREYEAALQFAGKLPGPALEKIKNRIKAVREAIAQIKFLLAHELFNKGKLPECLEALQAVEKSMRRGRRPRGLGPGRHGPGQPVREHPRQRRGEEKGGDEAGDPGGPSDRRQLAGKTRGRRRPHDSGKTLPVQLRREAGPETVRHGQSQVGTLPDGLAPGGPHLLAALSDREAEAARRGQV